MSQNLIKKTILLQEQLAKKIITKNFSSKFQKICAVDVSYKDGFAFTCAIIYDKKEKKVLEEAFSKIKSTEPYIPGLFMLKESKPILKTVKKLKIPWDVLLIDGNGQIHPRFCGLACFIGLELDRPTIGIAKKLLCGTIKDSKIIYKNKTVGINLNKVYISVGHKINLRSAVKLIKELIESNQGYPEPLRIADSNSKKLKSLLIKPGNHIITSKIPQHN